jgi:phosphoglycolate phosphatase
MTSPPRLAVFDVDGTLIDSQHSIVAAMATAYASLGLGEARPQSVRRIIGLSLLDAVKRLLPDHEDSLHLAVTQAYKEAFVALRSQSHHPEPLFPRALAALDRLEREGWLLGIATGKSQRGAETMIERHGLQGRFVTVQTADGHPGKPHPAMLLRAVAEAGAEVADTVMIGDTTFDMEMGRRARVRVVGVAWGYHPPEDLLAAGADVIVDDYDALSAVIASLTESSGCVLPQF